MLDYFHEPLYIIRRWLRNYSITVTLAYARRIIPTTHATMLTQWETRQNWTCSYEQIFLSWYERRYTKSARDRGHTPKIVSNAKGRSRGDVKIPRVRSIRQTICPWSTVLRERFIGAHLFRLRNLHIYFSAVVLIAVQRATSARILNDQSLVFHELRTTE